MLHRFKDPKTGEEFGAFVCTRGQRKRACVVCGRDADRLCDGKLAAIRYPRKSGSKTCDAPICSRCSVQRPARRRVPGSEFVDLDPADFCPKHADQAVDGQLLLAEPETQTMKAITVHAPYGWAIARADKRLENRDWEPSALELRPGDLLAIHQGKKFDWDARDALWAWGINCPGAGEMEEAGTLGAFVALATFTGRIYRDRDEVFPDVEQLLWWIGPLAWELENVRPVKPLPARGYQRLWNVRREDEAELLRRAG